MSWGRSWRALALALIAPFLQAAAAAAAPAFDWPLLIESTRGASELETAQLVNLQINRLKRLPDRTNWQREDFWATPRELFSRGGGDCEDFAIAKYFLLRAHGVAAAQLRLLFTSRLNRATLAIESHLVLLYQPADGTAPLVLDNLEPRLVALPLRRDLVAKVAFNDTSAWVSGRHGWTAVTAGATIDRWTAVQRRWARQQALAMAQAQ